MHRLSPPLSMWTLRCVCLMLSRACAQALERYITALLSVSKAPLPTVGLVGAVVYIERALAAETGTDLLGDGKMHSLLGGALIAVVRAASSDEPVGDADFKRTLGVRVDGDAWEASLLRLLEHDTSIGRAELEAGLRSLQELAASSEADQVDGIKAWCRSLVLCVDRCQDPSTETARVGGIGRARSHCITLPASAELPSLTLDITIAQPARPPGAAAPTQPHVLLYVLDPEPILFGLAALFAYQASGYNQRAEEASCAEALFHRMIVVGVGHDRADYSVGSWGWDAEALRQLRRRDFPPSDHPSVRSGNGTNAHAARLAAALSTHVVPFVEHKLLALATPPAVRALLGASYSAVLALQTLCGEVGSFDTLLLGSPSVPFSPEILRMLREQAPTLALAGSTGEGDREPPAAMPRRRPAAVYIAYGALEHEPPPRHVANVHAGIPAGSHELASLMRERGIEVEGPHEFEGEDHGTMKFPFVSRSLMWLARRVRVAGEMPST
uniref:Uncharacterized protein n=1 Tax=Calcidiscus leptoporus TaxID=127549 RepID=A0A7S0IYB2_9EUKA|mmetsp:Transcript_28435/g.66548  ORF Transcript_28435/g.66548 Transcript_28435/m.66548 type:complete len:499 (+) Transcript_28435:272-1768(+)